MTREYDFEYTDQKTMFAVTLACLGLFLIAILGLFYLRMVLSPAVSFVLALIASLVLFLLLKGKIKRKGTAYLNDDSMRLVLDGESKQIDFQALKYYSVAYYSGPTLTLKTTDGQKIKVRAHSSFCNPADFDDFCDDLEMTLAEHRERQGTGPVRKPSDFEHKLMKPALIMLTLALLGGVLYNLFANSRFPRGFFVPAMIVFLLWKGYMTTERKAKAREIQEIN